MYRRPHAPAPPPPSTLKMYILLIVFRLINPLATGYTPLCDRKIEPADNIFACVVLVILKKTLHTCKETYINKCVTHEQTYKICPKILCL